MEEENNILRETVAEFSEKNLDEKIIETEGISKKLLDLIASQGFLGSSIPDKYSGSGLDETSYEIILEEIAKYSPSVAMKIFILNSLYYPAVKDTPAENTLTDGATGKISATVDFINKIFDLKTSACKITGTLKNILGSDSDKLIIFNEGTSIVSGPFRSESRDFMGFRGLKFGDLAMDNDFQKLDNVSRLPEIMEKSYGPASAIALGMISGALQKAIEYTNVRKAFGNQLRDFEPVSFRLARFRSTETILRNTLYSKTDPYYTFNFAMEHLVEIARYSVNTHGGYGYFKDFGVEKFYRDAIVMKSIFYGNDQLRKLTEHVYAEKINFV